MLRKKPSPNRSSVPEKELQILYERRRAVDSLIRSLEQYDRFRAKPVSFPKTKSA